MTTVTVPCQFEENYVEALHNYDEAMRLEIDPYNQIKVYTL